MFGFFWRKREVKKIQEDTKKSFDSVKKDVNSLGEWIKHLHSEKEMHKKEIEEIKVILSTLKEDFGELRKMIAMIGEMKIKQLPKQVFNKQTNVYPVQTGVQTGVQTANLTQFSISEKAIIWILLNTDMNLSYDDLAAILKKERSTIRGQVNSIKQKNKVLIEEKIEKNGKKRVFIPEDMKEILLKNQKVRVKKK